MKMFYPDFPPMRKMFGTKSTTVVVEPPGSANRDSLKIKLLPMVEGKRVGRVGRVVGDSSRQ